MQEEKDIGIVTAIAAPAALEVKFFGDGGHAGAQLMPLRWVGQPTGPASLHINKTDATHTYDKTGS